MKIISMKKISSNSMRITLRALLLPVATLLFAGSAMAQELKIGYVNNDVVLRDSAPAKVALSKLQAEFSKREKELTEMRSRLKSAGEKFDRDQASLAEPDRSRKERELVEQDREFQRKSREYQEDINQRRNEETAAVIERAHKVIKQLAEQEKFDLIIVQEVIFASSRVDITEKVIKTLNAQGGK
jgi:outer membrane protein